LAPDAGRDDAVRGDTGAGVSGPGDTGPDVSDASEAGQPASDALTTPDAATVSDPSAAPDTPTTPDTSTAPPVQTEPIAPPQYHTIKRTRLSGTWVAISLFALVLVFLLIFILQNSHTVDVSYFGAHGHLPLGVALLLAAVCGILLVSLAGGARILQLRATARKHRKADVQAVKSRRSFARR
jgi:uncharacterized integral membrane protein